MKTVLLILLFPMLSFAGVLNGGGGKGVLCAGKLQTLDLYEAENVFHLIPESRRADLISELALGMERLNATWVMPNERDQLLQPIDLKRLQGLVKKEFYDKLSFIPPGKSLPLTNDATLPVLPVGCQPVQIALYNSLGIQVDRALWDSLDHRNQASLIFHELLYWIGRGYGAVTSDETRKFVGRVYSTTPPTPRFFDAPTAGYLDCQAGGGGEPLYDFLIYPARVDGEPRTVISFNQIESSSPMGRVSLVLPQANAVEMILDPNVGYSSTYRLQAEFHTEYRSFHLEKDWGKNQITVSVTDSTTGLQRGHATGICRLK